MKTSESIANIAKALAAFQKDVKQPEKDGNNPHFKSKYVTLDGTVKAIHDCAPKHGLSYTQMPVTTDYGVGVTTLIMHESGEFIQMDPFVLPMDKKTAQGAGSATTYARRYSLSAAFGIVSDLDDDGNEATENAKSNQNNDSNNNPATDKQIRFIEKLIKDVAKACNITEAQSVATLKQRMQLGKDINQYTVSEAKKAIEILQNAKKESA
ncbi:ERF family protein [Fictibacillus gelatini]|uniref:ERF family protein n=1 Tax=Fictibacillus gelatini TaxID=225985 RepID=UPI0003F5766C|nr:ERF family protein [Fictibacillus gelatini]